jgi:hypothetical protein
MLDDADLKLPGNDVSICSKSLEKFCSKRLDGFLAAEMLGFHHVAGLDTIVRHPND